MWTIRNGKYIGKYKTFFFQDFLIQNFKQYLSVATYNKVKDIELTSPIVEVKWNP